MKKTKYNKEILFSIIFIFLPLSLLFGFAVYNHIQIRLEKNNMAITTEKKETSNLPNIEILGKSAIVKMLNSGEILYKKNATKPLPLASLTKLMTTLIAQINLKKDSVAISLDDLNTEGDSLLFLGELFHKKDLIRLALISSSNDSAAALAANTFSSFGQSNKNIFISEMNKMAKRIGMKDSYFYNETGLDIDEHTAGAHGSAEDVATLMEYILVNNPEIIEDTTIFSKDINSISGLIHTATNTNHILGTLPNILASKTGLTDIAGGNLAVVIDPSLNNPVVIVVLGSTAEGRFKDVELLTKEVVKFFQDRE